ncbi:MAG: extracellular solute-binding protein [Bacillota bacterium]|nr:extracellular solute-binding protein [Bacillota bacterium]
MNKKLLSLLLSLALLLSLGSALAELPIAENFGDVKLRVAVIGDPAIEDWETNAYVLWLEEQTNIDLSFEVIPEEGAAEKLGLILASGDYPDVFLSVGISDQNIAKYGIEEKLFLPLNDLIDTHGDNIKKMFEAFPGSRERMTQLDGEIYSLPDVNICYHCGLRQKYWINSAWLDKLGLEKPTTTEEFYNVLVAFRDNDPNGNGEKDELPMIANYDDGWHTNSDAFVMNAFTYYPLNLRKAITSGSGAFGLYLDNGKVVSCLNDTAGMKAGLSFLNKLVAEGLFYEGSFSQNTAADMIQGEGGLVGGSAGGYLQFAQTGSDMYQQYDYLLPLKGPEGQQNMISFPYEGVGGNRYVISAKCENPEAALRLADLMYSFDATIRGYHGVYGKNWTDPDAGAVGLDGEPALYKVLTPWQDVNVQNDNVLQYTISYRDAAFRNGEQTDLANTNKKSGDGLEIWLAEATKEYEPFADNSKALPPLKFDTQTLEELGLLSTELSSFIKEGITAFMTGNSNVEDYESWLKEAEDLGLNQLIAYYQTAYDAQYK